MVQIFRPPMMPVHDAETGNALTGNPLENGLHRRVRVLHAAQSGARHGQGLEADIAQPVRAGRAEDLERLFVAAVHVQHEAVVVVDLRLRLRIELQHPFDGRQRLRVPPRVGQHDGEVELWHRRRSGRARLPVAPTRAPGRSRRRAFAGCRGRHRLAAALGLSSRARPADS